VPRLVVHHAVVLVQAELFAGRVGAHGAADLLFLVVLGLGVEVEVLCLGGAVRALFALVLPKFCKDGKIRMS
jgi:hypothetical protein